MTTVRQERIEIGKCGYYALDSLMNDVSIGTLLLHAKLMVRNSTGEASGKAASPVYNRLTEISVLLMYLLQSFCGESFQSAESIVSYLISLWILLASGVPACPRISNSRAS